MKTRIKERPVWSTEKTEEINRSVLQLNQQKQFAWQCGWKHIPWIKVQAAVGRTIKKSGQMLEVAMCYLLAYINLPMRISFSQKDDLEGADIVLKKTGIETPLKIQLKWNCPVVKKYAADITVVCIHTSMLAADVLKALHLERLLGSNWYKRITREHLLMVHRVINSIGA